MSDQEGNKLGPETVRAGKNLDTAVNSLISHFHHENDYFKVSKRTCLCVYMSAHYISVWTCLHVYIPVCGVKGGEVR